MVCQLPLCEITEQVQKHSYNNKKNEETCDPLGIFLAERAKSSTVTSECKAQILDMQMALYDYVNEINSNVALAFDKESMSKCFQ